MLLENELNHTLDHTSNMRNECERAKWRSCFRPTTQTCTCQMGMKPYTCAPMVWYNTNQETHAVPET
jgi:hypothetical protein